MEFFMSGVESWQLRADNSESAKQTGREEY